MVKCVGEFESFNMFVEVTAAELAKMFPGQHFDLQGRTGPFTVEPVGEDRNEEPEVIRIRDEQDPPGVFFINPKNPAWTKEVALAHQEELKLAQAAELERLRAGLPAMSKELTVKSLRKAEALLA